MAKAISKDRRSVNVTYQLPSFEPESWSSGDDSPLENSGYDEVTEQRYLVEGIIVQPKSGRFTRLEDLANDVAQALADALQHEEAPHEVIPTPARLQEDKTEKDKTEKYWASDSLLTCSSGTYRLTVEVRPASVALSSISRGFADPVILDQQERMQLTHTLENVCSQYVKRN